MRAGLLRHTVTVEVNVPHMNDYGEDEDQWSTFATRRARVTPIQASERWATAQLLPEVTHEVEMRHLPNARADMRVVFGTRVFTIQGPPVNVYERGVTTLLYCREQPSQEAS